MIDFIIQICSLLLFLMFYCNFTSFHFLSIFIHSFSRYFQFQFPWQQIASESFHLRVRVSYCNFLIVHFFFLSTFCFYTALYRSTFLFCLSIIYLSLSSFLPSYYVNCASSSSSAKSPLFFWHFTLLYSLFFCIAFSLIAYSFLPLSFRSSLTRERTNFMGNLCSDAGNTNTIRWSEKAREQEGQTKRSR